MLTNELDFLEVAGENRIQDIFNYHQIRIRVNLIVILAGHPSRSQKRQKGRLKASLTVPLTHWTGSVQIMDDKEVSRKNGLVRRICQSFNDKSTHFLSPQGKRWMTTVVFQLSAMANSISVKSPMTGNHIYVKIPPLIWISFLSWMVKPGKSLY